MIWLKTKLFEKRLEIVDKESDNDTKKRQFVQKCLALWKVTR